MSDVKTILAPEKTLRGSLAGGNTLKGGMSMGVINNGGSADLTGYATEDWVREGYQPKGDYLTEVPAGYAKTEDIPTKPSDIGAQPAGSYLTAVPAGYATEEYVRNKIAEAELGGEEVDLSGYAQKSELPTKVSQLENDKGYLTEHQDISGKLDASALPAAVNTALAQAKASGEFDGKDGQDGSPGKDGVSATHTWNGTTLIVTSASGTSSADLKGDKGDTGAAGSAGKDGSNGKDGVSATHSWNGTTLTVTSASGTSSANLKGDKGDTGGTGAAGADGVSPTVSVSKSGKVTTVSITDKNGTKTATINDGADGAAGSAGKDGTSVTVKSVSESTADGGSNVVTFSDGKTLTIKNGSKGSTGATGATGAAGAAGKNGTDGYTPVRGTDYWTEADKVEIVQRVIETLGGNPIFGIVDGNNNIIVNGDLPDGTYSVKYEMENGSTVNIGNLVIDTNVYYTVTNTLTQCTNSNSATKVVQGSAYSATITAKSGYELKSIVVTMGGTNISSTAVSGGKITIANVTGNIVITAVATEIVVTPTYTNLFDPSKATINKRYNSSGTLVDLDGYMAINIDGIGSHVPFTATTKIYIKGATFQDDGKARIFTYTASGETTTGAFSVISYTGMTIKDEGNGVESISGLAATFPSGVVRMAMCPKVKSSAITASDIQNIVITIDEPIA